MVRRLPLFRRSFEQVELYRAAWELSNEAALVADGPLWLVLGDSAAQGVGASAHDRAYVGLVLDRLRAHHAASFPRGHDRRIRARG